MSALVTRHNVKAIREQIDNFAFSLVAPLCADYHDDHFSILNSAKSTHTIRRTFSPRFPRSYRPTYRSAGAWPKPFCLRMRIALRIFFRAVGRRETGGT